MAPTGDRMAAVHMIRLDPGFHCKRTVAQRQTHIVRIIIRQVTAAVVIQNKSTAVGLYRLKGHKHIRFGNNIRDR